MKSRAGGYASVVHLDETVGAPQGGPHLPQACNTALGERRRGGGAVSPPRSHLSPFAMCPGNQEATSRPPKSKRSRKPPGAGPGPVTVSAARSAPAHPLMAAAAAAAPRYVHHIRRNALRRGTRGGGRGDVGWAGRSPQRASPPHCHGGGAAYGACGAYGGPDGGSWRPGGCRAPRGALSAPRGARSPTCPPATPSPSAHPRARPHADPAGRHPLPDRQHQLVLAPLRPFPHRSRAEPRSHIHPPYTGERSLCIPPPARVSQ